MIGSYLAGHVSAAAAVVISIALMLFTGFAATRVTKRLRLPDVTAYILSGILLGPCCLGLVPQTVIDGMDFLPDVALAFIAFCALYTPCVASIATIRREMNSAKWTWFAILYQCGFAYAVALMINQFGGLFTGNVNVIGLIAAIIILAIIVYMLVRPYKESVRLETPKVKKAKAR